MKQKTNLKNKKIYKILMIVIIILLLAIVVYNINNYVILGKNKTTNLVINNKNVTSNLKKDIKIDGDNIYLSKQDLSNFFDKYIYEDTKNNNIITTYNNKIAAISMDSNKININGSDKTTYAHAQKENDTIYVPITELEDVYGIEINKILNLKIEKYQTKRDQNKMLVDYLK